MVEFLPVEGKNEREGREETREHRFLVDGVDFEDPIVIRREVLQAHDVMMGEDFAVIGRRKEGVVEVDFPPVDGPAVEDFDPKDILVDLAVVKEAVEAEGEGRDGEGPVFLFEIGLLSQTVAGLRHFLEEPIGQIDIGGIVTPFPFLAEMRKVVTV